MASSRRRGITLVEVAVLIGCVMFLALLFIPPVNQSREASRRATCTNNQNTIARATIEYEKRHGDLPGYVQDIGAGDVSWVVAILPELQKGDVYRSYQAGKGQPVYMPLLVCPSNPPDDLRIPGVLAYTANCGMRGDKDTLSTAVFFNHSSGFRPLVKQTLDFITTKDGTQNTILVTENVGDDNWTSTKETDVGVVYDEPTPINGDLECAKGCHPRPSSRHGGVVVAAFCDGHVACVRDDISPEVYQQLMAPDDAEAFKRKNYPPFDPANAF